MGTRLTPPESFFAQHTNASPITVALVLVFLDLARTSRPHMPAIFCMRSWQRPRGQQVRVRRGRPRLRPQSGGCADSVPRQGRRQARHALASLGRRDRHARADDWSRWGGGMVAGARSPRRLLHARRWYANPGGRLVGSTRRRSQPLGRWHW